MNAKKSIFPPARDVDALDPEDDFYTGQPDLGGMGQTRPEDAQQATQNRGKAKGHAAYAVHDEMPPFTPRGKGFGPLGGLFAEEPAPAPESGAPAEGDGLLSVVTHDALLAECEKRICPSCPVKKEADEARLRALAEVENTKKRLAREREEQVRYAAEKVLTDIIPSLDNLDLALQHSGSEPACKNLVVGVQMTRKLLMEALAKSGLQPVGEVGEEFDPAIHDAVGTVHVPDMPNGHVCSMLSSGYKLNDRLLRPARVMVSKKGA